MGERRKLDKTTTGLVYKDHSYMVAGYISDYELTTESDMVAEVTGEEPKKLTVNDFEENRGYCDEEGFIHIFRKEPNKSEIIPWFTVELNSDMNPVLKFASYSTPELKRAFYIDRVGDLSTAAILKNSIGSDDMYDQEIIDELQNASSHYVPVIDESDDFLKKLVKTMLLETGIDAHSFKKYMEHSYQISNMIQGLNSKTKMNPFVFDTWMGLAGIPYKIVIQGPGSDPNHPLEHSIEYDSTTNRIHLVGKEGALNDPDSNIAVSARQFN
jgi:hypothetical protein